MSRPRLYTDEERKMRHRESNKAYRMKHSEQIKQYREENKEHQREYMVQWRNKNSDYNRQYNNTIEGRAKNIAKNYKRSDILHKRGECTITPEWIVENIFSGQKCHYCEEDDWTKLGCDRIDNSKPHTPDNVVPCCKACNDKRGTKTYEEFLGIK